MKKISAESQILFQTQSIQDNDKEQSCSTQTCKTQTCRLDRYQSFSVWIVGSRRNKLRLVVNVIDIPWHHCNFRFDHDSPLPDEPVHSQVKSNTNLGRYGCYHEGRNGCFRRRFVIWRIYAFIADVYNRSKGCIAKSYGEKPEAVGNHQKDCQGSDRLNEPPLKQLLICNPSSHMIPIGRILMVHWSKSFSLK